MDNRAPSAIQYCFQFILLVGRGGGGAVAVASRGAHSVQPPRISTMLGRATSAELLPIPVKVIKLTPILAS
jgi:hypothetical protein